MSRIPIAARLCPREEEIDARTTVERVTRHFPRAVIDWERGNAEVLRGVERLQAMQVPDDWVEAKRKSLGTVAYVELCDDRFPGRTGWFYASEIERDLGECFDLYSVPEADIPFLKHLAADVAPKLEFDYLFSTDSDWGIDMRSVPHESDPMEFASDKLGGRYGPLILRPLDDWKGALQRGVPLWFEHSNHGSKPKMIERAGSVEAVASEMIDALEAFGEVRAAWFADIAAPFANPMVIEHKGWTSFVSLSGAPKGILTSSS